MSAAIISPRIGRYFLAAMPYAQWLMYAVNFGYMGYEMFRTYKKFRAQSGSDARKGRARTFQDTMELVVKPRRKHLSTNPSNLTTASNPSQISEPEEKAATQPSYRVDGTLDQQHPIPGPSDVTIIDSDRPRVVLTILPKVQDSNSTEDKENSNQRVPEDYLHDDVMIVHDSRFPAGIEPDEIDANVSEKAMSDISTSLESTDSNNGIVKDIYSECFICARDLDDPNKQPVASLPFCLHPFHKSCLEGVLKWHPKCPVCDFHIFSPI